MNTSATNWLPRISLREFLGLVGIAAVGAAALQFASPIWAAIVLSVTLLLGLAFAIAALIDREARQAFAIGFATSTAAYGAIVWMFPSSPMLPPYASPAIQYYDSGVSLPTTLALRWAYGQMSTTYSIDPATGEIIAPYDAADPPPTVPAPPMVAYSVPPSPMLPPVATPPSTFGSATYTEKRPRPSHFMAVGHCLWALLIAYVGGKFATALYRRVNPAPGS